MNKKALVKFDVNLTLYTENEGGRRTPIENGYRTDIEFHAGQRRFVALQLASDFMAPGGTQRAICQMLLYSESEIDKTLNIKKMDLFDGATRVGTIIVDKVIERNDIIWKPIELLDSE